MERELTPQQLRQWLNTRQSVGIFDARNAKDFAAEPEMIPTAQRVDYEDVPGWAGALTAETPIVVYCQHGQRISNLVLDQLLARGLKAQLLAGGMDGWNEAKDQSVPDGQ